ncbi:putative leader peptide [Streptomyces sp. NBC_01341]
MNVRRSAHHSGSGRAVHTVRRILKRSRELTRRLHVDLARTAGALCLRAL